MRLDHLHDPLDDPRRAVAVNNQAGRLPEEVEQVNPAGDMNRECRTRTSARSTRARGLRRRSRRAR